MAGAFSARHLPLAGAVGGGLVTFILGVPLEFLAGRVYQFDPSGRIPAARRFAIKALCHMVNNQARQSVPD
jgi:hypothetical protein